MTAQPPLHDPDTPDRLPSGPGAAAIVAAGVGAFVLGVLAFAGDVWPSVKQALIIWKPSGPLSGVSSIAVLVWLVVWFALFQLWARRDVNLAIVNAAAFAMLAASLLLTFPPFVDLVQGK